MLTRFLIVCALASSVFAEQPTEPPDREERISHLEATLRVIQSAKRDCNELALESLIDKQRCEQAQAEGIDRVERKLRRELEEIGNGA